MVHLLDVDAFPIGTRVFTPTGRLGVVIAHKGAHSKHDAHERCVVQYAGQKAADRCTVELLPHLLTLAKDGRQKELF